jgi:hypothetical protein
MAIIFFIWAGCHEGKARERQIETQIETHGAFGEGARPEIRNFHLFSRRGAEELLQIDAARRMQARIKSLKNRNLYPNILE